MLKAHLWPFYQERAQCLTFEGFSLGTRQKLWSIHFKIKKTTFFRLIKTRILKLNLYSGSLVMCYYASCYLYCMCDQECLSLEIYSSITIKYSFVFSLFNIYGAPSLGKPRLFQRQAIRPRVETPKSIPFHSPPHLTAAVLIWPKIRRSF
jgi:hypothetical protein